MKAATYIERDQMLIHMRERELAIHQQKVQNIGLSNKAVDEAKGIMRQMKKQRQDRSKTKEFLQNERNIGINKDN